MVSSLPVSNQGNSFPRNIIAVVPIGAMDQASLELVQARDTWPLPSVQWTTGIDEYVDRVGQALLVGEVFELDAPFTLGFIPHGRCDLSLGAHILIQIVLCGKVLEVLQH